MISSYFTGINPDLLARIPMGARTVVEVGCGAGNFAAAYLALNPQVRYIGLELNPAAAAQARQRLACVIEGNIEAAATLEALDQALGGEPADVLVFGDVLEHLHDPWATLKALRQRLRPQGVCVACIPNVSHWSLLQQQLKGQWTYADAGLLDRTHLRFFTRQSAQALFQEAGWAVVDAAPRVLWPEKTEQAIKALAPVAQAWGIAPEAFQSDVSAFQWVMRAVNGAAPAPLNVAGLGLRKVAGVTEARLDYPLTALRSLPGVQAVWSSDQLSLPRHWAPGVLVLHRSFVNNPSIINALEGLAARGWLLVSDMDDDPHHWKAYADSDFRAFRGVHAVTVSTEPLAQMMQQWNPEVAVLPNGVMQLPPVAAQAPKAVRLKVFFGALNRQADWQPLMPALAQAALALKDTVDWVVVHDQAFFDALPEGVHKQFHPTLAPAAYMKVLAECDVSLLPLLDTPFNRLKSDLKFIESCAAGAVPICSPVVYGERAQHRAAGWVAQTPDDWAQALLTLCRQHDELARRRALGLRYVVEQRMHGPMALQREALYRGWMARREALEQARRQRLADRGLPLTMPAPSAA